MPKAFQWEEPGFGPGVGAHGCPGSWLQGCVTCAVTQGPELRRMSDCFNALLSVLKSEQGALRFRFALGPTDY